ncbi:MAG: hypothetical protein J6B87_02875 [Clostridia bacterium]|nr:hypothetical protein [Clostridia bacterium]
MIGQLPISLTVGKQEIPIRSNMRTALLIFDAINNDALNEAGKIKVMLECLYKTEINYNDAEHLKEAIQKAKWFLDGGTTHKDTSKKVIDWQQDEQLIFSAINKVAGYETRTKEDMHWWTFLGYFTEIGESLLSTIISIRQKKNTGKKLEKNEEEFYKKNKEIIDLKHKYTLDEQRIIDKLNNICK